MCGSDLETVLGLGGKSIDEMLSANVGDDLTIVLQTGGAKTWRSHGILSDKLQRWEIKNGKLVLVQTLDDRSMGDRETLSDFLVWGIKRYDPARSSLIFWDHGGGCAKGVCSDENHVGDTLRLDEVKGALKNADLKNKFEIIGFDACLMASIETAAAIKDYAQFMAASEENEPGGGWDYKAFAESLSKDTVVNTGKVICDSFMKKSKNNGKEKNAAMSFFDLSKTDQLVSEFNTFAANLNETLKQGGREKIVNAAEVSEKFGEGGSHNLVDLGDYISHADFYSRSDAQKTIAQFVVCSVSSGRNNKGVSFYFPVKYDKSEVEKYSSVCISKDYEAFLRSFANSQPT